jgi:hypothetical protein
MNIEIAVFWDAKQCGLVDGTKVLQEPATPILFCAVGEGSSFLKNIRTQAPIHMQRHVP